MCLLEGSNCNALKSAGGWGFAQDGNGVLTSPQYLFPLKGKRSSTAHGKTEDVCVSEQKLINY